MWVFGILFGELGIALIIIAVVDESGGRRLIALLFGMLILSYGALLIINDVNRVELMENEVILDKIDEIIGSRDIGIVEKESDEKYIIKINKKEYVLRLGKMGEQLNSITHNGNILYDVEDK